MINANMDFMGALLEEIALEGLDGITMPSLWKRLEKRPNFSMRLDDLTKQFLWGCIFQHKDIELFQLKEVRPPLVIYNRYNNLDLEMGIVVDIDENVVDIYSHAPVQSTELKGSCSTFTTRKNVSSVIKVHGKSYELSMSIYGEERLVLVGSQELRNVALLGTEAQPNIELTQLQYCILERIGRSRYHGETTMGKLSLAQMKIPSKSMFYLRKLLIKLNLVTKQVHLQRIGNATQHSSLLHLRRFYVERLSKLQVMLLKMCEILEQKPNKRELFHVLRTELGMKETSFKKMFNKALQVCVQAKMIPYGEFYPNALDEKRFSANGKERQVKIACLIKKYEEPDEEDFDDEDEEGKSEVRVSLDPRKITFDEPLLTQVYNMIEKAGPFGITSNDLKCDLGISKLDVRLLLRNLERRNIIFTYSQDIGRQRSSHYAAKCFEQENLEKNNLIEIKKKILSYSEECPPLEPYEEALVEDVLPKVSQDSFSEMDSIIVDFHNEDQSEVLTKAWNFSLKDITSICQVPSGKHSKDKESPNYTCKMLKRVNLVIEAVRKNRLIEDPFHLQKLIIQNEQEEGILEKIDKKSTNRIISRLAKDGYIRSIKTTLTMGKRVKKLHFVCDSRLTPDDPLIKSAIEQAKLKYFSISRPNDLATKNTNLSAIHDEQGIGDSGVLLRNITDGNEGRAKMEYIPSIGRVYGLQPKFLRMKSLHQFLFYLVYDYGGSQIPIPSQEENSPPVYHLSETWKHFVPPLPQHAGKTKGWCLVSDVLLCMPLSLLMKVVNFTYKIEGLEEFALDPVKQHFLIRHLPQLIRNSLLVGRRYIFAVHEVMTKLSFMGLLTFGPQQYKEKDQVFIYLHQNSSLKDTTLSEPGYMTTSPNPNYLIKKYHMKTIDDVETYWYDLENLCMHTPLGSLGSSRGRAVEFKNIFKEPAMIEAARQKTLEEVVDDGVTPGDGLGAAGLDSAMFAHLRRNWSWPAESALHLNRLAKKKEMVSKDSGYGAGVSYQKYLVDKDKEVSSMQDTSKTKRLSRLLGVNKLLLANDSSSLPEFNAEEQSIEPKTISTSIVSNIKLKKGYKRKSIPMPDKPLAKRQKKMEKKIKKAPKSSMKPRKPYYDEMDKMALNRMSKQRVCWSVQEDSFLLLCKVASYFLDPHFKSMVIPFSTIREFMHKRFPNLSSNKTSRACQRRIHYMMRNPTTVANVSVFLLEAKQDAELVRQFQGPKPMKRDEAAWTEMFTTVLDHLIEKFTLSLKDRCVQLTLPNSLDEFNRLYKVSVTGAIKDKKCMHVDPKNFVDIYCSVMFSFILSSMFTIGDKSNWSYTLYRVYQQYPDTLLRSVVARLKRDRLITKRKDLNSRIELTVPLSSLPHKISVHFDSNLQPRYQHSIYNQAASLFKNITKDHSLSQPQGLELSGSVDPGDTALIVSLAATHNVVFDIQVPEQVVIFDGSITEDLKSKIQEKVKQYEKEDAQDLALIDKDEMNIESSNFEVLSSKASRIALYMLRHELGHSLTDNLQHAHDYFLINTCGIRCVLRLHRHNKWYPLSPFKAQSAMDSQMLFLPIETIKPTPDIIQEVYTASGYSSDLAEIGVKLVENILEKKEFGTTFQELYYIPVTEALSLKEHLKLLIMNELVLRVGVTCFRYVALVYSKPWVLSSIKVPKDKRSILTEIATKRDKHAVQTSKRAKTSDPVNTQESDICVDSLPTSNDIVIETTVHTSVEAVISDVIDDVLEESAQYIITETAISDVTKDVIEVQTTCITTMTKASTADVTEDRSLVNSTSEPDSDWKKNNIYFSCIKDAMTKISCYSVESNPLENALNCADSLFQVAVRMMQCFSEEKNPEHLNQVIHSLPKEMKEAFNSPNVIIEAIQMCAEKSSFSNFLELLGSSLFVQNILQFFETLDNTVESFDTKNLFISVFFTNCDTTLESNDDLVVVFTQLVSATLLKGFDILLHTHKFCNILQALKILTVSIHDLKNSCTAKTVNLLRDWFEDNIMTPLENLNVQVEETIPVVYYKSSAKHGGKQCHPKDIENWFESSIMKKFQGTDPIVKETLELGVRFCVEDLLRKAESQSTLSLNDMREWFQETVVNRIESEDLKSWLQNCVLVKLETIDETCQNVSLHDWLVERVLNQLESSICENEKFLQSWLDETVLSKVIDRNETMELCEWMERLVQIVMNDEKKTSQEKSELRNWMNSFVIKKVEDMERIEVEKQMFIKWFEENVLGVLETPEPAITVPHSLTIKNILMDALQEIERQEDIQRFKETRKKLNEVIQVIHIEENSRKDLQEWFSDCILHHVQERCDENSKDIPVWFEENILKVLELSQRNKSVDVQEVKLWLEEEILKLLNDTETALTTVEVQEWFQTRILHVIDDVDQGNAESSKEAIGRWFNDRIMLSVEELCVVSSKIKEEFEEHISKLFDSPQKSSTVEYFEETRQWFEENVMKELIKTESINTCFDIKEWFQQNLLKVFEDFDETVVDRKLKSDVKACLKESVLYILERLLEAKNCLESDVLDVITRNIEATECLEKNVLDVVVTTSELVENINNSGNSMNIDNVTEDEVTSCMNSDILDVIETTSDVLNSLNTSVEYMDVVQTDSNPAVLAKLHPFYKQSAVIKCLQDSLLNVIDESKEEQMDVDNHSVVEYGECLNDSVLDVIDTITEIVNLVDNQHDNQSPKLTSNEVIQSEKSENSLSNSLTNITSIKIPFPTNQEPLPISTIDDEVKKFVDNDMMVLVEKFSVVEPSKTFLNPIIESKQSKINNQDIDNVLAILETSVLDIVQTTSELIGSVTDNSENFAKADTTTEDIFTEATNCLEESVLTVVDKVSDCLNSVESLEIMETEKSAENLNIKICLERRVLDVIDVTSELITSVQESEVDDLPPTMLTTSSENADVSQITDPRNKITIPEMTTLIVLDSVTDEIKGHKEASEEVRAKRKRRSSLFESTSAATAAECEAVRFVSRPWRKPDGSLNRKTLERYLVTMLGHVMTNPGISEEDLFLRFEITMQPVLILELLEILSECECVVSVHVKQSHLPGLFDDPVSYILTSEWDPDTKVFYEGTPDAILKLSYFLSEFVHYRT